MYCMGDISSKLELTRRDLIDIALLSGSDYTEGYGMEWNGRAAVSWLACGFFFHWRVCCSAAYLA
jgi:hypothetical protein